MSTAATSAASEQDVLAAIPLFSGLTPEERAELTTLLKTRNVAAGQTLFFVDETGDDMFIIQHGQIVISFPNEGGDEVTLAILGPGQFFGEISLLDGGPRTATARGGQVDSVLLSLNRTGFAKFLEQHVSATMHVVKVLGQRQRESVAKLRGIKNVNDAIEEMQTPWQRVSSYIAGIGASSWFLIGNLLFFLTWMAVNTYRSHQSGFDPTHPPPFFDEPPTFFTLGFIVCVESILLSMFVLNSQRQQAERDRIRADLDYQVNLKAHSEVT